MTHYILHQYIRPDDQMILQLWEDLHPTAINIDGYERDEPFAQWVAPVATPVQTEGGEVIQLQVKIPLGNKMPLSTARDPITVEDAFAQFDRIKADKNKLMPFVKAEMQRVTKLAMAQTSIIARPR